MRQRFLFFVPYGLVGIIHLVALFLAESGQPIGDLAGFSKLLLMPALLVALLGVLLTGPLPQSSSRIALVGGLGILFSWFGDALIASPGDLGFLLGLGSFLLAHLAYLTLIARELRVRRVPRGALAYAIWWVAFVAILAPHAGVLLVPIAIYGLVLGAVAAFALAANRVVAVGAGVFLVSDSLLGLHMFLPGFEFWQIDVLIMLTYLGGQGLIAWGALEHTKSTRARLVPEPVGVAA
jgi:alkenylglycerophosphocholine/alkenylglycerophosphoethanolamine hydrolase